MDTHDSSQTNIQPAIDPEIFDILNAYILGDYSKVPEGADEVSSIVRKLGETIRSDAKENYGATVKYSMNASEAMTEVSRMTGYVRETDARTQTMATAVEEMTASIGQITESSNMATELAEAAHNGSNNGVSRVNDAIRNMEQVATTVGSIGSRTENLIDASKQIAGILETIDAIAKQTNLLALNATIEAARAGEHGKGFAVVASEVKNLANDTSRATEDIRTRIDTLTGEISGLTEAMETCNAAVDEGKGSIGQAGEDIRTISDQVSNVSERMSEIAKMLAEQTEAGKEIGSGISSVAELTEQNRTSADRTLDAVGAAEALIEEQFAKLDTHNLEDSVLYRAKSDHFIWKKRLAEMFVGLNNLQEEELADHHQCRLGKWYDQVEDSWYQNSTEFKAIVEPHSQVHAYGKTAARHHAEGDHEEADRQFKMMEDASLEVVNQLDKLIAARTAATST